MSRIGRVVEEMKNRGLDHLVVSDPSSIFYLIGYRNDPGERMFALVIDDTGKTMLFMNRLFYFEGNIDSDMIFYTDTDDYVGMLADYLKISKKTGIDKTFTARFFIPLMERIPQVKFVLGSECVDLVRMIKTPEEQALMRESSRLNDLAMDKVIKIVGEGKYTEKEVGDMFPDIWKSVGSTGNSFDPIVGYGKNGADNHHTGDDSMIKPGDTCVIDMGGLYQDWCSDMTRTIFYKEAPAKKVAVYNLVLKAQLAAEAMIKPGVRLCDIDKCARDIIAEGGYTVEFNHRLGHFIGLDVHEWGDVSANFDMEVKPGMVFSIEPGVYIKNNFGVRIEDLVLVTEDGCEVLNHYTKDIIVVGNEND